MNLTTKLMAAALLLSGMSACKKDYKAPPNPNLTFKATLSGAQETPVNSSTATGTATLVFDPTTKIFTLSVTHTITNPTNGHIHKAAAGVPGPVIFPFPSFTSPISYTSAPLDATQEADLRAELYYVNIHTAAFPGGEIRGQLMKQ